jgi:hypothetical protein
MEWNSARYTSLAGDRNSSRVTSERVVENSSQDVSPFAVAEVCVGVTKVEFAFMMSEATADGLGDEPSDDWNLKMG